MSSQSVAAALHVHHTTFYSLHEHVAVTGSVIDRSRGGSCRETRQKHDQAIHLLHVPDCFQAAAATARSMLGHHGRPVNCHKVRRRLSDEHVRCLRPCGGHDNMTIAHLISAKLLASLCIRTESVCCPGLPCRLTQTVLTICGAYWGEELISMFSESRRGVT